MEKVVVCHFYFSVAYWLRMRFKKRYLERTAFKDNINLKMSSILRQVSRVTFNKYTHFETS